jgi:hypothetical protein
MVRPIARIAAILAAVAVPVEWLNNRYCSFPIDVGYEHPTWMQQLTGTEWTLLHSPGLLLMAVLEGHGLRKLESPALILSGYLDTFLLALLTVLLVRWVARRRGRTRGDLDQGRL